MKPIELSPALRAQCVNTLRMLAVDCVEHAKSVRDRFVLSGGHASMMLSSQRIASWLGRA